MTVLTRIQAQRKEEEQAIEMRRQQRQRIIALGLETARLELDQPFEYVYPAVFSDEGRK
jgi:hypothetical protein